MELRILGPLKTLDNRHPLALGGAKQRALLAVLLLQAGEVVSADRLVGALWGEDPPETARGALQVYVANLQRILEPARPGRAAGTLLATRAPGYLLGLGRNTASEHPFRGPTVVGCARVVGCTATQERITVRIWPVRLELPAVGQCVTERLSWAT